MTERGVEALMPETDQPTYEIQEELSEHIQAVLAIMVAQQQRDPPTSKQMVRASLKDTLGLAYELGYSEKWMRKAVERAIAEIKADEHWDGKKG